MAGTDPLSPAHLAVLLAASRDGVLALDGEGRCTYVNPAAARLLGRPPERCLGCPPFEALPGPAGPAWEARFRAALAAGGPAHFEARRGPPDAWYEASIAPDAEGGAVVTLRDVTERALARREAAALAERVRRQEGLLGTVSNAVPALIAYVGVDERYHFVNAVYEAWFERPASAIVGKTVREVLGDAAYEVLKPRLAAAFAGEIVRFTTELKYATGLVRWVEATYTPHVGPDGAVLGIVSLALDVGDRKRAEAEREALLAGAEEARRVAEAAGRAKDEFLSTLSHELRTPLNAILGWANLLRTGAVSEAQRARALETVERNARVQARLIDDLLDLSRIVQGKLVLSVGPLEMVRVVEAALEALRPAAEAKGVRLQPVLDSHATVVGDEGRLQQIVWNLLSNAVKFTPRGGRVQVRLRREQSYVEVAVADTGRGIEPEFLPHVFDRFRQADGGTARQYGGLGLGLAIVRSLVELHGGTVEAKSDGPGRGATFVVRLPTAPLRADRAPATEAPAGGAGPQPFDCPPELRGLRVLVVDDESDTRDLLAYLLGQCGAEVTAAPGAAEALELVRRGRFDAIVSDVGMPGDDGYALLRRVRALPAAEGGRTPALALTAYARSEDRTAALRAGFQLHVAKPVEASELLAALAALIAR
ncbi:MAG TPA: PAS domain-containing protein [Polyangiaceae bacterium]|nr:PAS domain-containing protein [Polyangiaceae bacterium]